MCAWLVCVSARAYMYEAVCACIREGGVRLDYIRVCMHRIQV